MTDNRRYFVRNEYVKEGKTEVIEIYESYSGWYWFITEDNERNDEADDGTIGRRLFGLVVGADTEWGYTWSAYLEQPGIWKVPKKNWFSISHIIVEGGETIEN